MNNFKLQLQNELRSGESINSVCKKYRLTFAELIELVKTPTYNYSKNKLPAHIYRKGRQYAIYKQINGKCVGFGEFESLKQAKKVVQQLIIHNWKLEPMTYLNMKYIVKLKHGYQIRKTFDGVQKTVVSIDNENDAIKIRDLLVKYDWDLSYLPLILKTVRS